MSCMMRLINRVVRKLPLLSFSFTRQSLLEFFCGQQNSHAHDVSIDLPFESEVWRRVDHEVHKSQNRHERYWWKHSGYILAVLLDNAGYSAEANYRGLKHFATVVARSMGVSHDLTRTQSSWPSFMTDDGIPIELSWDWGTGQKHPTIRYSIEPISLDAGTSLDPHNGTAAIEFHERLIRSLPGVNVDWYDHFKTRFGCSDLKEGLVAQGHSSQFFYAFDLAETGIMAKAYFFPGFIAKTKDQSTLEAISEAISTAPRCTKQRLCALSLFLEFAAESRNTALEYEMLAIDLSDPSQSRLKIYFRSRETNFSSITNVMTLSARTKTPALEKGLLELRNLWDSLFNGSAHSACQLNPVTHRTAGILYNIEFKLNSNIPVTKIYIPVRHYSQNDREIINRLQAYLHESGRGRYIPNYTNAMDSLFSQKSMHLECGLQTYIGCSILHDGSLRIVSYINPQTAKYWPENLFTRDD